MTINYAASAAGISWLALTASIDERMQMEQAELQLSKNGTKVQCDMTKANSDATLAELTKQADGLETAAKFSIGGAGAGIAVSVGTLCGALGTMPTSEGQTITNKIGIDEEPSINNINSNEINSEEATVPGKATVEGRNEEALPKAVEKPAPEESAEKGGKTTASKQQLNRYLTDHGHILSQTITSALTSSGQMKQADYTREQAFEKSIEAAAQGNAQVMNQQQNLLSSTIGASDSYFNNTESALTTIIQVSAVRG